jgi:hypothetical protein
MTRRGHQTTRGLTRVLIYLLARSPGKKLYGADSPLVALVSMLMDPPHLAWLYLHQRRYSEAEQLYGEVVQQATLSLLDRTSGGRNERSQSFGQSVRDGPKGGLQSIRVAGHRGGSQRSTWGGKPQWLWGIGASCALVLGWTWMGIGSIARSNPSLRERFLV